MSRPLLPAVAQGLHALLAPVPPGQPAWVVFKDRLGTELRLSDDTMHMSAGLALLMLAALALRRTPWSFRPWLAVLAVEVLNEAYDLTSGAEEGNWSGSLRDLVVTMFWPTLVLLFWRRWGGSRSGEAFHQSLE